MPKGITRICKCGHSASYHLSKGCEAGWKPFTKKWVPHYDCKCKEFCDPSWKITTF